MVMTLASLDIIQTHSDKLHESTTSVLLLEMLTSCAEGNIRLSASLNESLVPSYSTVIVATSIKVVLY